uniref:Radial spoke head protein 6 homolog A n=1 Tax=Schistocephalus solidus TaxID=70667 RepID=A0A183SLJ5_SCHSO
LKDCIKLAISREPRPFTYSLRGLSAIANQEHKGQAWNMLEKPIAVAVSRAEKKIFAFEDESLERKMDDTDGPLQDLMKLSFFHRHCGVGLSSDEYFKLMLSMKSLIEKFPLTHVRFWGKIFGILQNYYIVETEVAEGEVIPDSDEENEIEEKDADLVGDDEKLPLPEDDFPKRRWKPPPPVPQEEFREGVNKFVYFVCHFPGGNWIRLPHVKPQQICVARQISRFFTGNLDAPVESFPTFPGTEANYLRAQIARITACTHVSPEGYFSFEEDEVDEEYDDEEDEEDRSQRECIRNLEYIPLPISQLGHPGLKHWVHHSPYILPQGRIRWLNPASMTFDEASEQSFEKEEEDEEAETKLIGLNDHAERGLPLLTSIANDISVFGQTPWTVHVFDSPSTEQTCVLVSSNLWVGAHALAWDRNYDNIYIGWGLKATGPGLNPYTPPEPMEEAKEQPQEATDPTPAEEAAANEPEEEAPEETDSEDLNEQGQEY